MSSRKTGLLKVVGPGILVAATGVGAGDLATGAFTGSKLGVAVLWAVVLGAFFKFVLNEGLARWQLATGSTLLEGSVAHFGRPIQYLFLLYLLFWSYMVGSALMSACGVAAHALLPLFSPQSDKILYGLVHSGVAVILVEWGGYRLFQKVMSLCIGMMFFTVLATTVAVQPDWSAIGQGLVFPKIPDFDGQGLEWTVALMGGIGGTVTVLCYGYWIREEGREGADDLTVCRYDLASGYLMTALFGIGMVILGSRISVDAEAKGATLIVQLAEELNSAFGSYGSWAKWAFLVGAWGAVSSSLLGVWQSVPYLFADFWGLMRTREEEVKRIQVDTRSFPYRLYLYALATLPAVGLWTKFEQVQKIYAIVGAAFIPILALCLVILNGRSEWVGERFRNSPLTSAVLILALLISLLVGWFKVA